MTAARLPAHEQIEQVPCPLCGAGPGERCKTVYGGNPLPVPHGSRRMAAADAGKYAPR